MHTPYHLGQRHHSPPQTIDPSREQYAPFPPPPPTAPGGAQQQGTTFPPPPPPRRYPSIAHGPLIPPPPPTAPPGPASVRQPHWQRQPNYFTPPPPPPGTSPPVIYNPNAFHNYQYQESKPLTSANYIPSGISFGPGVGIPALNPGGEFGGEDTLEEYEADVANFGLDEANHPDIAAFYRSPTVELVNSDGNRHGLPDSSVTAKNSSSPDAIADGENFGWSLDIVLNWLASNEFSKNWQETFKKLNIQGSQFLEIGRGAGGKGNFGMMHNIIYPQLAKECTQSGAGWDQSREQEEGRRLRRLIKTLKKAPTQRALAPMPAEAAEDVQQQAHTRSRRSDIHSSSPSTGGTGENSPVPDIITNTASPPQSYTQSSATPKTLSQAQEPEFSTAGPFSPDFELETKDSEATSSGRAQSSSRPRDSVGAGTPNESQQSSDLGFTPQDSSPLLSPATQRIRYASSTPQPQPTSTSQPRYYTHTRGRSSESNGSRSATFGLAPWSEGDGRRQGYDGHRPQSGESNGRTLTLDPPSSAKDHRSIFKKVFTRGAKRDDSHPSPDEIPSQSPSSPVSHRLSTLPHVVKPISSADMSIDRPSSRTAASDADLSLLPPDSRTITGFNDDAAQKYLLVTVDAWNYRLVNISAVDSVETLKDLLRYELALPDIRGLSIHSTSPGQLEHDEPLSPNHLHHVLDRADTHATLKLFIKTPYPTPIGTGMRSLPPASATSSSSSKVPAVSYKAADEGRSIDQSNISFSYLDIADSEKRDLVETPLSASGIGYYENNQPSERSESSSGTGHTRAGSTRSQRNGPIAEGYKELEEARKGSLIERRGRQKKDSPVEASPPFGYGYRRGGVIDFDIPRPSPFEGSSREETLVPHRNPPPVPPTSTTLLKANSLSKKNSTPNRQSWPDSIESPNKTINSDDRLQDSASRGRRRAVNGSAKPPGVASALAGAGRLSTLIGVPGGVSNSTSPKATGSLRNANQPGKEFTRALASVEFGESNSGRNTPNGSPRSPGFTMSKGNVSFKIPEYEAENTPEVNYQRNPSAPPSLESRLVTKLKEGPTSEPHASPDVSPSTAHPPTISRSLTKRGPTLEFSEVPVEFEKGTANVTYDSDEDSDDGLFAVPLAGSKIQEEVSIHNNESEQETDKELQSFKRPASLRAAKSEADLPLAFESSRASDQNSLHSAEIDQSDQQTLKQDAVGPVGVRRTPTRDNGEDRPQSFVSDGWAPRPPAESLVEHLDDFFPNVNLDQPVLEEGQRREDSQSSDDPIIDLSTYSGDEMDPSLGSGATVRKGPLPTLPHLHLRKNGRLGRTKSIREVVKGQYQQPGPKSSSIHSRVGTVKSGDIVRRTSTKMFGAKIEQIKPSRGSRLIQLETIPQQSIPQDTISTIPHRQRTFKWVKGQLIGKGSFGRVYLGMNTTTGELMAVKQVEVNPKQSGQDKDKIKEMVKALDQEIDTMQHLDHVNIVQYLGCERKEFSISIFLEYISGGSIGSCLRKHGKFEEPVVSSLTRQSLNGLAYLHDAGILHRDLKADNILLDIDGTCKISDFGISKKTDDIYGNDATNSMQGSVFWMAPEVVRSQGQGYSAKVDIWSLGCVVLEMFAGKRPWSKEEVIGAIFKLGSLNQAPPIPDEVSAVISPAALSFMYDCFNVDPAERPTADTLLEAHFCYTDPNFNFLDTELYDKIRPNY